jgi:hypothetical protein
MRPSARSAGAEGGASVGATSAAACGRARGTPRPKATKPGIAGRSSRAARSPSAPLGWVGAAAITNAKPGARGRTRPRDRRRADHLVGGDDAEGERRATSSAARLEPRLVPRVDEGGAAVQAREASATPPRASKVRAACARSAFRHRSVDRVERAFPGSRRRCCEARVGSCERRPTSASARRARAPGLWAGVARPPLGYVSGRAAPRARLRETPRDSTGATRATRAPERGAVLGASRAPRAGVAPASAAANARAGWAPRPEAAPDGPHRRRPVEGGREPPLGGGCQSGGAGLAWEARAPSAVSPGRWSATCRAPAAAPSEVAWAG